MNEPWLDIIGFIHLHGLCRRFLRFFLQFSVFPHVQLQLFVTRERCDAFRALVRFKSRMWVYDMLLQVLVWGPVWTTRDTDSHFPENSQRLLSMSIFINFSSLPDSFVNSFKRWNDEIIFWKSTFLENVKFGRDLDFINGNLFSSESMSQTSIAHSGQWIIEFSLV